MDEKGDIDRLIDTMISGGDELVENLRPVLPAPLAEQVEAFHESHAANLRKIRDFLNGWQG